VDESAYVPPPAFAPPALRVAPLNETAVLGRTSYPHGPYAQPATYAPPIQPPAAWYPASDRRPSQLDDRARRRRALAVLSSLGVVAALVTISVVLVSGAHSHHARSLSLPRSVDDYTMVRSLSGSEVRSMFVGGGTFGVIPPADLAAAHVGIYAELTNDQPNLLFIGFTGHDSPTIGAQLRAGPPSTVAGEILDGAGATTAAQTVDAGPLGGAMQCAVVDVDGSAATVGVWADADTLGILMIVGPTITAHTTAPTTAHTVLVTRDFRAAAEH
jgi:hypothetical protein